MDNSTILKQIQNINKEGFVQKQSRFLKSWRQRWVVLTKNIMLTYKERRVYQSPTQIIFLKDVVTIKSTEQPDAKNCFKLETHDTVFLFEAENRQDKEAWIGAIGKAMVKSNNKDMDD